MARFVDDGTLAKFFSSLWEVQKGFGQRFSGEKRNERHVIFILSKLTTPRRADGRRERRTEPADDGIERGERKEGTIYSLYTFTTAGLIRSKD